MIGVAIQGAGWVATEHIRAYEMSGRARVVAIGSRTREGARRKADEMGLDVPVFDRFEDLLAVPEVDAVSICTPPPLHCRETCLAASAGKAILVEKPIATNVEELHRMGEAVRRAGVTTVVSFVLRWNPAILNILAVRERGMLGTVFNAEVDYWHNLTHEGLTLKGTGVSAMVGGGCHAVDAARNLVGGDIVQVNAISWGDPDTSPEKRADLIALLRFSNGAMAKVSACTSQWMPYDFNINVFGTEGVVRKDRLYTKHLPGLVDYAHLPTVLPDSGDVAHHPFPEEIGHFLDCIETHAESPVSVENAINTHEACFAADLSAARGGVPVRLPLGPGEA